MFIPIFCAVIASSISASLREGGGPSLTVEGACVKYSIPLGDGYETKLHDGSLSHLRCQHTDHYRVVSHRLHILGSAHSRSWDFSSKNDTQSFLVRSPGRSLWEGDYEKNSAPLSNGYENKAARTLHIASLREGGGPSLTVEGACEMYSLPLGNGYKKVTRWLTHHRVHYQRSNRQKNILPRTL